MCVKVKTLLFGTNIPKAPGVKGRTLHFGTNTPQRTGEGNTPPEGLSARMLDPRTSREDVHTSAPRAKSPRHSGTPLPPKLQEPESVKAQHSQVGATHSQVGAIHSQVGAIHSQVGVIHSQVGVIHSQVGAIHSQVGAIHSCNLGPGDTPQPASQSS
jgi:hypothetical protein